MYLVYLVQVLEYLVEKYWRDFTICGYLTTLEELHTILR